LFAGGICHNVSASLQAISRFFSTALQSQFIVPQHPGAERAFRCHAIQSATQSATLSARQSAALSTDALSNSHAPIFGNASVMGLFNLEVIDILLPLVATVFIGFISLKTLDHKQSTALQYQRDGCRVPWHLRRMLRLSRQELRIDMIGRCCGFFLTIIAIQMVKAFDLSLVERLLISLGIALVLLSVIPRLFVLAYQRLGTSADASGEG
jgi:hypothetical protein